LEKKSLVLTIWNRNDKKKKERKGLFPTSQYNV
jgi:hypothetical protein